MEKKAQWCMIAVFSFCIGFATASARAERHGCWLNASFILTMGQLEKSDGQRDMLVLSTDEIGIACRDAAKAFGIYVRRNDVELTHGDNKLHTDLLGGQQSFGTTLEIPVPIGMRVVRVRGSIEFGLPTDLDIEEVGVETSSGVMVNFTTYAQKHATASLQWVNTGVALETAFYPFHGFSISPYAELRHYDVFVRARLDQHGMQALTLLGYNGPAIASRTIEAWLMFAGCVLRLHSTEDYFRLGVKLGGALTDDHFTIQAGATIEAWLW